MAVFACAPVLLLLGSIAAFDLLSTRVDDYSRRQLGARYESPADSDWSAGEDSEQEYYEEEYSTDADPDPGASPPPHELTGDPFGPPEIALPEAPSEVPGPEPVFYIGRGGEAEGEESSYNFQDHFNPFGYGSLSSLSDDVFASGIVERRWTSLDPAFRQRIFLRSRYPFPRQSGGSEEIGRVLASSGLAARYPSIRRSFELVARAASAGQHDDVYSFLSEYSKCIEAKRCTGYDFYERATLAVHDAYSVPAALLLAKGHCTRAIYLNAIGLRMLRAIDPPRFAARGTVNRMYMLSAIAEQEECPGQRVAVARAIDNELFGDATPPTEPDSGVSPIFRASSWHGRLPDIHRYAVASAQLRLHDYAGALATLDRIRGRKGHVLDDMANLMRIRALFALARAHPPESPAMHARMESILASMRPSSLRSDVEDYVSEISYVKAWEQSGSGHSVAQAGGAP